MFSDESLCRALALPNLKHCLPTAIAVGYRLDAPPALHFVGSNAMDRPNFFYFAWLEN